MSQPKMTSQNAEPDSAAGQNLSRLMYLPRSVQSISNAASLTRRILCFSKSSRIFCSTYRGSHNTVTDGTVRAAQKRRFGTVSSVTVLCKLERHPDRFHVGVLLEGVRAQVASEPALLVAAKRRAGIEAV